MQALRLRAIRLPRYRTGSSANLLADQHFRFRLKPASPQRSRPMALIPRWQYMTDSSKAMVKRSAITLVVVLIGLTMLRAIFPWILLGLALYGAWCLVQRK